MGMKKLKEMQDGLRRLIAQEMRQPNPNRELVISYMKRIDNLERRIERKRARDRKRLQEHQGKSG
jgi:hypothetical protein